MGSSVTTRQPTDCPAIGLSVFTRIAAATYGWERAVALIRMTGDRFAPVLSSHEIFDPRYISLGEDSSGDLYALSAPKGIDRIEGNRLVEVNHDLDLLSMVDFPEQESSGSPEGTASSAFPQPLSDKTKAGPETPLDYAWFGRTDGMASTQCSIGTPNMALARRRQALGRYRTGPGNARPGALAR